MNEQTAIVPASEPTYFLAPAAAVNTVLAAYQAKKEMIEKVLCREVDYGIIPGSGNKPALLKPGAEKLAQFFGLTNTFDDVATVEDWTGADHGGEPFFYYRVRCTLWRMVNGERVLVASADGSCNSWEKKYRYRQQERTCPACGKSTIIKGKQEYGGGWLCFAKKGGCGAKYPTGDPAIENQQVGQVKNPDTAEMVNTFLKMAQKRALVAATLIATAASDYFTQDVDDYVDGDYTTSPPPVEKPAPAKPNGNGNGNDGAPTPAAWDAWAELTGEADSLGIEAKEPPAGVSIGELRKLYKDLQMQVEAAKAAPQE